MQPWNFLVVRSSAVKRCVHAAFAQAHAEAADLFEGDKRATYQKLKLEGILEAPLGILPRLPIEEVVYFERWGERDDAQPLVPYLMREQTAANAVRQPCGAQDWNRRATASGFEGK